MYKIAILGTESAHAMTFAKYINLPRSDGKKPFPDMEVTGVYGDAKSAGAILREAGVKAAAKTPDEFLGAVDAVMVTVRKGSLHAPYARPYAEAGVPLFIDKPFTSDSGEAEELVRLLKAKKVPVCGGSSLKHAPAVHEMKALFEKLSAGGDFITAALNFNIIPESEYDGLFFYAQHLVEMALTIFGEDVKTVVAFRKNDSITAVFGYEKFDVTLLFTAGANLSSGTLYGKRSITHLPIDISTVFEDEVRAFYNMLITGTMPQSYESMVLPVKLIELIERSYKTGKTIVTI